MQMAGCTSSLAAASKWTLLIALAFRTSSCEASIQITTGPQNATVFEGESVLFRCSYTGTDSLPYWRIAGTTYSANRLPREYISTADGIFITSVETSMNNTKYICFFTIYVGGGQFVNLESLPAYLLVLKYRVFTTSDMQTPVVTMTCATSDTDGDVTSTTAVSASVVQHSQYSSSTPSVNVSSTLVPTNMMSTPSQNHQQETNEHCLACFYGITIGTTIGVLLALAALIAVILSTYIWIHRRAVSESNEPKRIQMKKNSAYETPPIPLKMKRNEAYTTVTLQH